MRTEIENELHILQTQTFIDVDPVDLVLRRRNQIPDGVGGLKDGAPVKMYAQRVRVVGQVRPFTRINSEGIQVSVDRSVVGTPEFDVEIGDTFTYKGSAYEVMNIQDSPVLWRRVAEAVRRA